MRSYRSLEHGTSLQEAQLYDDLCAFFGLSYNYEINIDDVTFPLFDDLVETLERYEDACTLAVLQELKTALEPYKQYSYEAVTLQVLAIFIDVYQEHRLLREAEYDLLKAILPLYPPAFQNLLAIHTVSYTHLDVYKRQVLSQLPLSCYIVLLS